MKALFVLLVTLTGCASLGPSAEQIKEMANTSSSFCVEAGPTIYSGAIAAHYSSFGGKAVGTGGGGGSATCGKSTVTFTNEGKADPTPKTGAVIPPGMTIGPGATPGTFTLQPK